MQYHLMGIIWVRLGNHSWNIFKNEDLTDDVTINHGYIMRGINLTSGMMFGMTSSMVLVSYGIHLATWMGTHKRHVKLDDFHHVKRPECLYNTRGISPTLKSNLRILMAEPRYSIQWWEDLKETRIPDGFLKIFHETNLVAWGKLRQNHGEVPISLPDFGVQAM